MKKKTKQLTQEQVLRMLWNLFRIYNKIYNGKLKLKGICYSDCCVVNKFEKCGGFYDTEDYYIVIKRRKDELEIVYIFIHELAHLVLRQLYGCRDTEQAHSPKFKKLNIYLSELFECMVSQDIF